jgi:ribosome-associated protein
MEPDGRIPVTARLSLDPRELEFHFIRSSGPGGQNVNKVATAVQLRFDAAHSPSLPEAVIRRLLQQAGRRATNAGEIVITAQRFRTQEANRKDAVARLVALIEAASHAPRPRVATRPTRAAKKRRLESKKHRAATKRDRQPRDWD